MALHSTIYIYNPLKEKTTAMPDLNSGISFKIDLDGFGEFVWSCCVVVFCCLGDSQNTAYEYWSCKDAPLPVLMLRGWAFAGR